MKISVVSHGSRGDTEPPYALACALHKRGYSVEFIGSPEYKPMLDQGDFPYRTLKYTFLEREPFKPKFRFFSINYYKQTYRMIRQIYKRQFEEYQIYKELIKDSDVVISDGFLWPILEKYFKDVSKKVILFWLQYPVFRTIEYPCPFFYFLPNFSKYINWGSYRLLEKILLTFHNFFFKKYNINFNSLANAVYKDKIPLLHTFPTEIFPHPKDWPSSIYSTGNWTMPLSHDFNPEPDLLQFLEEFPQPICVCLGIQEYEDSVYEMIFSVINALGKGCICVGGVHKLEHLCESSESIFYIKSIPYPWLFQHCSLAIHHGGAGTTINALKYNIPSVVLLKGFNDRYAIIFAVYKKGLMSKPLFSKKINKKGLAKSIKSALEDKEMRQRLKEISDQLQKVNGIENAIEHVENILKH